VVMDIYGICSFLDPEGIVEWNVEFVRMLFRSGSGRKWAL
jgi:hypothetical protein